MLVHVLVIGRKYLRRRGSKRVCGEVEGVRKEKRFAVDEPS
jgi:hypothetical protein